MAADIRENLIEGAGFVFDMKGMVENDICS